MKIIELVLDEEQDESGIEAISIVESPAIEEDFIALKSDEIKLAEVSKDKKLLMGALLVPNKPIYRKTEDDEYYIYFSKKTIVKASQLYLKNGNQNNSTLEHQHSLSGLTLVESWIVESETQDKSRLYNLNVPVGTWMGTVKVNNDEVWNEYVKTNKVKGFSIEGYFADKMERPKEPVEESFEVEAQELLSKIEQIVKGERVELNLVEDLQKEFGKLQTKSLDMDLMGFEKKYEERIPKYNSLEIQFKDAAQKAEELGVDKMAADAKEFAKACQDRVKLMNKKASLISQVVKL